MSKPVPIQPAWILSAEECKAAGEPLAACLGGLPDHIIQTALNIINPVAAAAALFGLYSQCKSKEDAIVRYYQAQQAQTVPTGGPWGSSPDQGGDPSHHSNGSDGTHSSSHFRKPVDLPYGVD